MSKVPAECTAFTEAMKVLGRPWNGLIIQALREGPLRFVDIRTAVAGISDAMVSARLKQLMACQIIETHEQQPQSSRRLYRLTKKGQALLEPLDALTEWSHAWVLPHEGDLS